MQHYLIFGIQLNFILKAYEYKLTLWLSFVDKETYLRSRTLKANCALLDKSLGNLLTANYLHLLIKLWKGTSFFVHSAHF